MRINEKQWQSTINQKIDAVNFHRFMEMDDQNSPMEMAQEFGISLGEVKKLKRKITRA